MGRDRSGLVDWAIAVGVAVVQVVAGVSERPDAAGLDRVALVLLAGGGLALAARRRAPVAVLVATAACALGYQVLGYDVPVVAYLVAVYAAVRAGHRLVAVAVSVLMLGAVPLAILVSAPGAGAAEAFAQARDVLEIAWLVAAGAAGEALRQAEARADEAERTREETARRRADEERLHIARELHDSLTHQISVITVQSEVAVHLARRRGEDVPESLLAIRTASREASRELRSTLDVLRDDTTPHGLDDVPELVRRVRGTGLDATLHVAGPAGGLPPAVDRTAYRIVQESLTNVTRHASAAHATVRIDRAPGALVIEVDDDGCATPEAPPVAGVGLRGMGERVSGLGGRLEAAPRREGGFSVRAELPVEDSP